MFYTSRGGAGRETVSPKLSVVAFLVAFIFPDETLAFDGNEMLSSMPKGDVNSAFARGYIFAVSDLMSDEISLNGYTACIPMGIPSTQLLDVVKQDLEDHPELRHHNAEILVAWSFSQSFPC
jgi:hypothetical protein